ncbi:MAG: SecD/SecF family protein translocase subunit [Actinomycetota bacterium]
MQRKLVYSLSAILLLAVSLMAITLGAGYHPALGLDLRGGISVTLRPVTGQAFDKSSLDLAVERIRERVDSFGVGEPEILRQDDAIVVNLPGVNDQQQAIDLVNVTGKVYLRPVIGCANPVTTTPVTSIVGTATTTGGTATTAVGNTTVINLPTATTGASATSGSTPTSGAPGPARRVNSVPPTTEPTSTTTAALTATPPTGGTATTTTASSDTVAATGETTTTVAGATTTTGLPFSDPAATQVLPTRDGGKCQVGPSGGTGEVFVRDSAAPRIIGGGWGVTVDLKTGGSGEGVWNALAKECFNGTATCPSKQLAIELDGQIQSAPTVNAENFTGSVQITGNFTKNEATKLAQVMNSGALPITLQAEAVQTVSATLGKDSLRAALIAGAIGVALVLAFMFAYYRRLAVVVLLGLCVSGTLVYSITSFISRFYNGVLSLAGVAGLIVSIGVTIDSYVVFFERLKDEMRAGRSLRNSAQRGFKAAFHTILVADSVSLIGAAVLWYLSVGAVRGFAFYLGLSTLIDVFVAYFFTRPAVLLLARSKFMSGKRIMGMEPSADANQALGATS